MTREINGTCLAGKNSEPPNGCRECAHYSCEGIEGYDCWWPDCSLKGNEHFKNLKYFPFKKTMPCFQLNFWLSEFAEMISDDEEKNDKAFALYREKYVENKHLTERATSAT